MNTCEVCKRESCHLDHGVCGQCLLSASQALLTAADVWREPIAQTWIHTSLWQDGYWAVNDLYCDANRYISALIDWQDQYKPCLWSDEKQTFVFEE